MRYHYTPVRMAAIQSLQAINAGEGVERVWRKAINAGEGVEKREPSYTLGGNAN